MSATAIAGKADLDSADDRPRHIYDPEHLRAFLKEQAWCIGITMQVLGNFLDLRDDAGAEYAAKQLIAYTRVTRDVMVILRSLSQGAQDEGR